MSGWFKSLGWWSQEKAFASFEAYRSEPTECTLNRAIEDAIPIIRVVFATQKFRDLNGIEDDLISSAALTISRAIPKMAKKPTEKISNDKHYMRYLFTCVINAFFRELDVLFGKPKRLEGRLSGVSDDRPFSNLRKIESVEAQIVLSKMPGHVFSRCAELIRFDGKQRQICEYILLQFLSDRELSKSVLTMLGCSDRRFYVRYCLYLLLFVLTDIRTSGYSRDIFTDESGLNPESADFDNLLEDEEMISALLMEDSLSTFDSQEYENTYNVAEYADQEA